MGPSPQVCHVVAAGIAANVSTIITGICASFPVTDLKKHNLRRLFRFTGPLPNLRSRYNVAPTQQVPIVRRARGDGERELAQVRWGLIPFWAKDAKIGYKLINARVGGDRREAVLPGGVEAGAPLPDRRRRVLRVGEEGQDQAALAHHAQRRRALRLRGPVGAVGEGAGWCAGRELHHHHDRGQCARRQGACNHRQQTVCLEVQVG